jgi:hypothetical protein
MYNIDKYLSPAYWRAVAPQIIIAFAILGLVSLGRWIFS